ncbi:MAG: fluoride efflux transporter CrcB [Candidatus Omnitrophica bacterium]|nr:fluoride efflux transporter CrcB [Candidatus Omnitrophota bacterium]
MACLLVGCGGFLGAIARYLIARGSASLLGVTFPYGTFIINVSGSFLLGVLATWVGERLVPGSDQIRLFFAIGFLGAYTTFSTFEFETQALFEDGSWLLALTNIFGSLFLGLVAVRAGIVLAKSWM